MFSYKPYSRNRFALIQAAVSCRWKLEVASWAFVTDCYVHEMSANQATYLT